MAGAGVFGRRKDETGGGRMKKSRDIEVSLCPEWIVFAREKIRELETENARLKIENRKLITENEKLKNQNAGKE